MMSHTFMHFVSKFVSCAAKIFQQRYWEDFWAQVKKVNEEFNTQLQYAIQVNHFTHFIIISIWFCSSDNITSHAVGRSVDQSLRFTHRCRWRRPRVMSPSGPGYTGPATPVGGEKKLHQKPIDRLLGSGRGLVCDVTDTRCRWIRLMESRRSSSSSCWVL